MFIQSICLPTHTPDRVHTKQLPFYIHSRPASHKAAAFKHTPQTGFTQSSCLPTHTPDWLHTKQRPSYTHPRPASHKAAAFLHTPQTGFTQSSCLPLKGRRVRPFGIFTAVVALRGVGTACVPFLAFCLIYFFVTSCSAVARLLNDGELNLATHCVAFRGFRLVGP